MTSIRKTALALAALLAACALLPAAAGAATGRTVAVTATATVRVPNDTATIGFGVRRERKTRGAALQATAKALRRVIATAQAFPGVGAGDIRTGRISITVRPVRNGEVVLYRASEGISVTLHEPAKAGELIAQVLGAGASGVNGPSFGVGNQEEAFGKALAAAFLKAKERATILATQAGAKLGEALTIEEGEGTRIFTPETQEIVSASAHVKVTPPPTKPGTSKVRATVHVVFELT